MPISMHRHKRLKRSPQPGGPGSGGVTVRALVELVNAFDYYACPFCIDFMCTVVSQFFFFGGFFNQHFFIFPSWDKKTHNKVYSLTQTPENSATYMTVTTSLHSH